MDTKKSETEPTAIVVEPKQHIIQDGVKNLKDVSTRISNKIKTLGNTNMDTKKSETIPTAIVIETKSHGGANNINQKLNFLANIEDINKIKYKELVIVQYSTKNRNIEKNVKYDEDGRPDFHQYIANFQQYIETNNKGINIDYTDRTKDKTLEVKKYPIHQYFNVFNRNNGFDYKGLKNAYIKGGIAFLGMINYYDKHLDKFSQQFENYQNNKRLDDTNKKTIFETAKFNIYFVAQNYYGFIIIIIILFINFWVYFRTVLDFFNSVYSRKMSLDPNIIDNSMYNTYVTIYKAGDWYTDTKIAWYIFSYTLLFIFVVLINIYYLSDSINGRLRVMNFILIPWISYEEVYVFDKQANTLMFYGVILLIVFTIFNFLYNIISLNQQDILKTRYESNTSLQELYNYIDMELLDHYLKSDVYEENLGENSTHLNTYETKLANWMYNGTEAEMNQRIGKNTDTDLNTKRYKILITTVFAKHYVNSKYKRALYAISNPSQIPDMQKPSIFLYSKDESLNGVLPSDYTTIVSNESEIMKIILGDPLTQQNINTYNNIKTTNKCFQEDSRYLCKQDTNLTNYIATDIKTIISYFRTQYTTLYKQIQKQRIKIKSKDSAIMYRVDVILSFIFMLILGLCLIQIFLWLFFDNLDIYEAFISKHISKIKTIFQIIVLIIILIVIL